MADMYVESEKDADWPQKPRHPAAPLIILAGIDSEALLNMCLQKPRRSYPSGKPFSFS